MILVNQDSLEYFKSMKDESIDLVITDPPYGIKYKDWDNFNGKFVSFTEQWLNECYRILKPNGTLWFFFAPTMIKEVLSAIEFTLFFNKFENWSVWARQKGRGASKKLKSVREDVFHLVKDEKDYTWNNIKMLREVIVPYVKDGKPRGWFIDQTDGFRKRWTGLGNVWNYSSAFWKSNTDPQIHPAQKPSLMLLKLILISSNEGDIVFDPFMGSGSTGVASWLGQREFIGVEKEKEIFDKATNWISTVDLKTYKGFTRTIDRALDIKPKEKVELTIF
jgi:site-specific DNA-methyltransferase (adenine-specific)